ncbi:hypothetical protein B296_00003789 [Ensete ventricosum]|uniref:Uncharacterized protein n=1 Tax=Ensete ventricosum TaxID=4639 RepID=A0A426Z1I8_ENSVE|nr:hypothetical protein B296_00003789 [Ensete ventricosum]
MYCLLCSLVEHSCINPKSSTFGYLDEKPISTSLMKFLGLYPQPYLSPLHSPPFRPLEIGGEVKARQPYTLIAVISFARIQEERLNHEVRRTMVTPRLAMSRPTIPSTTIQTPAQKTLTRDELRERSARGYIGIAMNHGAANITAKRVGSS